MSEVLVCISCFYISLKLIFIFLQWSPDKSSVFGSSAEDGLLNIWDYDKVWRVIFSLYMSECFTSSAFLTLINVGCRLVKR